MAFERSVDVRWRDSDALGHVNHAVFLTYLEEGRDAFFEETLRGDPDYVVVRLEVDLRAEVRRTDQRVTVRVEVESLGTTSITALALGAQTREIVATVTAPNAAETTSAGDKARGRSEWDARAITETACACLGDVTRRLGAGWSRLAGLASPASSTAL